MIIVAFDPGSSASWARYDTMEPHLMRVGDVSTCGVGRMTRPCAIHVTELIDDADLVLIEEVGPMQHDGVSSSFTFGMAFGALLAAVQAAAKPLRTVTPQQWSVLLRTAGRAKIDSKEKKAAAVAMVREMWPCTHEDLSLKKHHNRADAALIIRWFVERGPGRDAAGTPESS